MAIDTAQLLPWHGRHLAVRRAGTGPTIVLIHGMAGSLTTWDPVFDDLAKTCDVIAVDLPGHGGSSRMRGDYSLGSLASSVRDVLDALEVKSATIVGHSLGGGIAMQFMYQFPERCERLVLVSSGGLGREVTPMLRALSVPGAGLALAGVARAPAPATRGRCRQVHASGGRPWSGTTCPTWSGRWRPSTTPRRAGPSWRPSRRSSSPAGRGSTRPSASTSRTGCPP